MRAVLACSYRQLPADARRMFRLLGLHLLSTRLGFRSVQGEAWDSLGYAHHRLPGSS